MSDLALRCGRLGALGHASEAGEWPAIVAAARSCMGTPFRPQGRVVGLGLDCVGVVLIAAAAAGVRLESVPAYGLSGDNLRVLLEMLQRAGCVSVASGHGGGGQGIGARGAAGDIAVLVPAAGRLHLGVLTPGGLVHAHAGLGQVVEGPVDPCWSWLGVWRLKGAR